MLRRSKCVLSLCYICSFLQLQLHCSSSLPATIMLSSQLPISHLSIQLVYANAHSCTQFIQPTNDRFPTRGVGAVWQSPKPCRWWVGVSTSPQPPFWWVGAQAFWIFQAAPIFKSKVSFAPKEISLCGCCGGLVGGQPTRVGGSDPPPPRPSGGGGG